MKKTYINPEMEVIKIHTQQMLATSIPTGLPGSANDAEAPEFEFMPETMPGMPSFIFQ